MSNLKATLYWVESTEQDKKWFVVACSELQAMNYFSNQENTTFQELQIRDVGQFEILNADSVEELNIPFTPTLENLESWGFTIFRAKKPYMVRHPSIELFVSGATKEEHEESWKEAMDIYWGKKGMLN